jgi:hypothetical protein
MIISKNNDIEMVRGNSESFTVSFSVRPLAPGDIIEFTVRTPIFDQLKIHKKITEFTDGKAVVELIPEDTKDLFIQNYNYDVRLTDVDGIITTIIECANFKIKKDVTR